MTTLVHGSNRGENGGETTAAALQILPTTASSIQSLARAVECMRAALCRHHLDLGNAILARHAGAGRLSSRSLSTTARRSSSTSCAPSSMLDPQNLMNPGKVIRV
jgi:hypothetical protein